jgi:SsrA-binding protein
MEKKESGNKILNTNRRAYHDYQIFEKIESGICLKGTEIKSLRSKACNVSEAYVRIQEGEAWLCQMEIPLYPFGNSVNHEPFRKRKLLLHKNEITHIEKEIEQKNLSCIPIQIHLKGGRAKILLGIGKGKQQIDKRENIKKKDVTREIQRVLKNRS